MSLRSPGAPVAAVPSRALEDGVRHRLVVVSVAVLLLASMSLVTGTSAAVAGRPSEPNGRSDKVPAWAAGFLLGGDATADPGSQAIALLADDPVASSRWSPLDSVPPRHDADEPARLEVVLEDEAPDEVETLRLRPRPRPGPFSMNLYEKGDFVHQLTVYWCVAASVQTMMNVIDAGAPRRSAAFQRRLHFQGRRLDQDQDPYWRRLAGAARWRQGLHGLGLTDWAGMLNTNGYGPYKVDRARTLRGAIQRAARAIRETGRPAGLVVWRGAHAWVMSGFTATADPAFSDDFKVRSVFIQDPWYPFVSSIWGRSRPPNARVPVASLGEDYLPYNRPRRRHPARDGKYMIILPTLPPDTIAR